MIRAKARNLLELLRTGKGISGKFLIIMIKRQER